MKIEKVRKWLLCLAFAGTLTAGFALTACTQEEPAPIQVIPPAPTATAAPTASPAPILVYVSGEVVAPDVYELAPDSRIKQLVEAAGGFTTEADPAAVNLAQPLADGAHVHVPALGEPLTAPPAVLSTPIPRGMSVDGGMGLGGGLININTADQAELEKLPGIGPKIAQKILEYRAMNGPFVNIEAIMEVSGIGQVKFDQIRQLITTSE